MKREMVIPKYIRTLHLEFLDDTVFDSCASNWLFFAIHRTNTGYTQVDDRL